MTRHGLPDIRAPEAIDAAWLEAVLRLGGVEAAVSAVEASLVGAGMYGTSVRFELSYARGGQGAPRSLVGKFPSQGAQTRMKAAQRGSYVREVRFYQHLAKTAQIDLPHCWFADVDETTHDFVLLMEDLTPAEPGDQLKGVTLDQARDVMMQAAKLHAAYWREEQLADFPWMSRGKVDDAAMARVWEQFKARYGAGLPPEWLDLGDYVAPNASRFAGRYDGPLCLTHNDFRPDNMMFAKAGGSRPVTVLDWQSFGLGGGAGDVAYFLAGALPPDLRRAAEPELLDLYHRRLVQEGVNDYDRADLQRHYAQGGYQLFVTAFYCAITLDSTPRGEAMFLQMLAGAAQHMLDHRAHWS